MLDNNWFFPSTSLYGAPLLIIRNRTGEIRIDYRLLSKDIILDRFPLPYVDDLLDCLNKATTFSKVDLINAYH